MRPCQCGGTLWRRDKHLIKATGEVRIRLRCSTCGARESLYLSPQGELKEGRRPPGRPGLVDSLPTFSPPSPHVVVIE
jgi:hypothetical protein